MKTFLGAAALAGLAAVAENAVFSSPIARAPGLNVEVTGPSSVKSTADLKVTTKISNTGSSPLKVLTFNTPLQNSKVNNFEITKDGKAVQFTGIKANYKIPSDSSKAFTTIGAGEAVTVEHSVGDFYNFADAGAGKYTITPTKTFLYTAGEAAKAEELQVLTASASTFDVDVSGELTKTRLSKNSKRATTDGCSADQSKFIYSSLTEAVDLANAAVDYISSNDADDLYTAYFGTTDTATISDHFKKVAGIDADDDGKGTPWSCTDPYNGCEDGVIAYTVPSTGDGAFCSPFFEETTTDKLCTGDSTVEDRNIRGGTSLHEETHLLDGTDDYGYGVDFDKNLASTNPEQAAGNADNHNTFATEVWLASKC